MQNLQSAQLHAPPRSVSSNRSRSPTPHRPTGGSKQQQQHQQSADEQKKRSRSPTPHRKLLASPNQADLAAKQRSMSPTPWTSLRSRSPTPRKNADTSRRNANEEPRSPTHHGKPQENARVRLTSVFLLDSVHVFFTLALSIRAAFLSALPPLLPGNQVG